MPAKHVVSPHGTCPRCGGPTWYSTFEDSLVHRGYDAVFCDACDVWLEEACSDARCTYCADRPERPSQVALERLEVRS